MGRYDAPPRPMRIVDSDDEDEQDVKKLYPDSDDEEHTTPQVPVLAESTVEIYRDLASLEGLILTQDLPPVFKCRRHGCGRRFPSEVELRSHKVKSEDHDYCRECDLDFPNEKEYHGHLVREDRHKACPVCFVPFKSRQGLRAHCRQNHRMETPARCSGCTDTYPSLSGLLQHYESNECSASLGREIYHESLAARIGTTRTVPTSTHARYAIERPTKNQALICDTTQGRVLPSILDHTSGLRKRKIYAAEDVERFWNPLKEAWCCPVKGCKKEFRGGRGSGLATHLNSQAHAPATFRCCGCHDKFKSASALSQHIDTNSCGVLTHYSKAHLDRLLVGDIGEDDAAGGTLAVGWGF